MIQSLFLQELHQSFKQSGQPIPKKLKQQLQTLDLYEHEITKPCLQRRFVLPNEYPTWEHVMARVLARLVPACIYQEDILCSYLAADPPFVALLCTVLRWATGLFPVWIVDPVLLEMLQHTRLPHLDDLPYVIETVLVVLPNNSYYDPDGNSVLGFLVHDGQMQIDEQFPPKIRQILHITPSGQRSLTVAYPGVKHIYYQRREVYSSSSDIPTEGMPLSEEESDFIEKLLYLAAKLFLVHTYEPELVEASRCLVKSNSRYQGGIWKPQVLRLPQKRYLSGRDRHESTGRTIAPHW